VLGDFSAFASERMRQDMPRYDERTLEGRSPHEPVVQPCPRRKPQAVSEPPRDPPAAGVVRRHFQPHAIAIGDSDVMDAQPAAPLGQDRPPMGSGLELDRVKTTSAALRDDSLENEKVTVIRICIRRQSVPRFVGDT